MKKFLIVVLMFAGVGLFAQNRHQMREEKSSEEMATLKAQRLTMQLDLNEEQQGNLKQLFQKHIEARKEKRAEMREKMKEKRSEMREERMEESKEFQEELKDILNEEQYKKFQALQEKRRMGRKSNEKGKDW